MSLTTARNQPGSATASTPPRLHSNRRSNRRGKESRESAASLGNAVRNMKDSILPQPAVPRFRLSLKGWFLGVLTLLPCAALAQQNDYAVGADLSFLKQAEDRGMKFKESGVEKP